MERYKTVGNNRIKISDEEYAAMFPEGTALEKIASLKAQLAESDYKAIKYAEGWLTEEEYAPIKAERQKIRDEINKLELELKA